VRLERVERRLAGLEGVQRLLGECGERLDEVERSTGQLRGVVTALRLVGAALTQLPGEDPE